MNKNKNNDNFMTEKEKSFVSSYLVRNLKRQIKHKDYSIFFNDNAPSKVVKKEESEKQKKKNTKKQTKEKEDKSPDNIVKLTEAVDSVDITPNAKTEQKAESKKAKEKISLKEILKTSLLRTSKKSRKKPRIIVKESIQLSETLSYKIKIECLFDKIIYQQYVEKSEDPEMIIDEDDFFYFLDIPKFFTYSIDFFSTYNESSRIAYLQCLLKYAIKIQDVEIFEHFVSNSYEHFPILQRENILKSEYFDSFYFSAVNVVLAKYLLLSNENYSSYFYDCLSNDNLELIFSLDNDFVAWQFLAVFIKLLCEDRQAVIVSLVRERVIETVNSDDERKTEGLILFLDAIGIDKKDLQ